MHKHDNDPLHAPINAKLADIVAAAKDLPAWHDVWMALGPQTTEEERLRVYQAIRDAGVLPEDAGLYLVSWQIDAITSLVAEEALGEMEEQLAVIQRSHGLKDDEFWLPGEAPEEYEELRGKYQEAWDRIYADKLEEFGEREMARLFRTDAEEFQRRSEAGREFFHGPDEPEESEAPPWVCELAEAVAGHMTAEGAAGPLGFRYREEEGLWELVIYPTPVELVGGADDGEILTPGFSLDLEELRAVFQRVDAFAWQSHSFASDEGPHVLIEGVYQEHEILVQILACAPEDEEPGMKLDTSH